MSVADFYPPSALLAAIEQGLRNAEPGVLIATRERFDAGREQPWVLLDIERNTQAGHAIDGRRAQVLRIALQVLVPRQAGNAAFAACDLASRLMDVLLHNRWGWPAERCGLPAQIQALPSSFSDPQHAFDAWTLSFDQALYQGQPLLDDPLGRPLFARSWEVSNIDDPNQYRPLED
ncbi:hypothetical protein J4P02_19360 [Pseudomonas sp. NFXW11]|uniref:hypothetical protein n=1 Tax=Pseudomonas sp. NFXW11 TaxID=2819531 RepID=UPI003CF3385A